MRRSTSRSSTASRSLGSPGIPNHTARTDRADGGMRSIACAVERSVAIVTPASTPASTAVATARPSIVIAAPLSRRRRRRQASPTTNSADLTTPGSGDACTRRSSPGCRRSTSSTRWTSRCARRRRTASRSLPCGTPSAGSRRRRPARPAHGRRLPRGRVGHRRRRRARARALRRRPARRESERLPATASNASCSRASGGSPRVLCSARLRRTSRSARAVTKASASTCSSPREQRAGAEPGRERCRAWRCRPAPTRGSRC